MTTEDGFSNIIKIGGVMALLLVLGCGGSTPCKTSTGYCESDSDCCSGLMCSADQMCLSISNRPNGQECDNDSQCASGYCPSQWCTAPAAIGSPCDSNSACETGNCDYFGGWCTKDCTHDRDCPSGTFCDDGLDTCTPKCTYSQFCQRFVNGGFHVCQSMTTIDDATVNGCGG